MTIKQEATKLIYNLPDDSVRLVVEMMRKMLIPAKTNTTETSNVVANRIGLGKDIINDPEHFNEWDAEIADLFEE